MPTVLLAWELGSGLGHLTQLAVLANPLARRGHGVHVAARELGRAPVALDPAVSLLPAPCAAAAIRFQQPASTFPNVLSDIGWSDERSLEAHTEAWRNLYRLTKPDLIVFDHSPTALLAARGAPAKRVIIGNGFTIPADVYPLPNLRVWAKPEPEQLHQEEDALLARANRLLKGWNQKPLERLGQLYSQVDLTLLATLPELDPYASLRPRPTAYRGPINPPGGQPPQWPQGGGKKVFVYLRDCPATEPVLRRLIERGASVVAMAGGLSTKQREALSHPLLHMETERLDVARVARECDLGVLNANFATSVALLLGGKPALHLPMYLEHILTARAVRNLRAGLDAPGRKVDVALQKLDALLDSDRFAEGAARFARRYCDFNPARAAEGMVQRCLELLEK